MLDGLVSTHYFYLVIKLNKICEVCVGKTALDQRRKRSCRNDIASVLLPEIFFNFVIIRRHVDHPGPLASLELLHHLDLLADDRIGGIFLFQRKILPGDLNIFLLFIVQGAGFHLIVQKELLPNVKSGIIKVYQVLYSQNFS